MVSLLKWTDDLLIHIDELDDQHRHLFLLINRLIVQTRTLAPREEILGLLQALLTFSLAHFRTEEKHMETAHYPGALPHSKEHLEFTQTVQEFIRDYGSGEEELSTRMLTFLRHWWVFHVAQSDQEFGQHLKNKGNLP